MKICASDRIMHFSSDPPVLILRSGPSGNFQIHQDNLRIPYYSYLRWTPLIIMLLALNLSCKGNQLSYKSPPGFDLTNPEIFRMPEELHEISGIAFNKGNPDKIYAEQDEKGKLFHFKLGDTKIIVSKFSGPGDFEDVSICVGYVVMLRSDGVLFSFPLSQANQKKADYVQKWKDLLPPGEYEGIYSIDSTSELFVLCKHCKGGKADNKTNGFIFKIDPSGKIKSSGSFKIDIKEIGKMTGENEITFHPSALAFNSINNEWFVLSSVNKLLVITGSDWHVKGTYALNPVLFRQPEGIAFDNQHNLYISNERNSMSHGTVLKFKYNQHTMHGIP